MHNPLPSRGVSDVPSSPADVQATFCATLADEWVRLGVRHAVVAPGSRSTPMALALAEHVGVRIHIVHDERVAAFYALGLGLDAVGRVPAVVLCTSGTAAANLHPAVVEASLSAVPMLVVTADRPPELRDVGAPQTIDQTHLFGRAVRWFHDPGVADPAGWCAWRSLARRAFAASTGWRPADAGPVHLNLPFREPLLGRAGDGPPAHGFPAPTPEDTEVTTVGGELLAALDRHRGVIVAGGRSFTGGEQVRALSAALQWPILADPTSGIRDAPTAVAAFDSLLRNDAFAVDNRPEVVVRVGRPPASKQLATWIADAAPLLVQVGGPGVIDPDHGVAAVLPPGSLASLRLGMRGAAGTSWMAGWQHAAERAEHAIAKFLGDEDVLSEPGVARVVAEDRPAGADVVVASSMPVRDLEWFGGPLAVAHANRGANGIDGTMSTAMGLALARGRPVVVLAGDIAVLHDANALIGIIGRDVDVRIVVVDNDGGGIFSFLPQATQLPEDRFETLFGTPHGVDLETLARAHGITSSTVTSAAELSEALARSGPALIRVPSDRARNVEVHAGLHRAVHEAL